MYLGRKVSLLFVFIYLLAFSVLVQADEIDNSIKSAMHIEKIPGMSLAIVQNGKLMKAQGYGYANLEHKVLAKPETIYHTASIGKQFVATLVMMLVEEGKLKLTDKIKKYIKESPKEWENITIRHLLTHTSGVSDYYKKINLQKDYTDEQLIKMAISSPLQFQPGEKFSYSNTGYMLLGMIIKKATGQFYGNLLSEKIFNPLGMHTAHIINELDHIPNRAAGYELIKNELKDQSYVSPTLNRTAEGSLDMTVLDLAKWDASLDNGKLLQNSSFAQMWQPVVLNNQVKKNYGFGWRLGEMNTHPIIWHSGKWQGFSGIMVRYLDKRLTIIILCNLANVNLSDLAHKVASLYDPSLIDK